MPNLAVREVVVMLRAKDPGLLEAIVLLSSMTEYGGTYSVLGPGVPAMY